jgi:8-oxo-dGTP pyrophosphatase MutT (NUDIX family)
MNRSHDDAVPRQVSPKGATAPATPLTEMGSADDKDRHVHRTGSIRAAGGVVVRRNTDGQVEVLLVHRPRYGDWTLPKGKAMPDENDEECALREVEEETGLRCTLVRELASSRYMDQKTRPRFVRYWEMSVASGLAKGQNEVDEVAWMTLDEARMALTYERDSAVLRSLDAPPL